MSDRTAILREQLNRFEAPARQEALAALAKAWRTGQVAVAAPREEGNLHCHSFFSFNGYGYSPSALAWLARERGWRAVGLVDFDVLDGVGEFLEACDLAAVRGVAGLETRVYVPEFATREINSPGEPGIFYLMGMGFTQSAAPAGRPAQTLAQMRHAAESRNRQMMAKLAAHLEPLAADYDHDVLPLTPKGNATERHMLVAYDELARRRFPDQADLAAFWAAKLGADPAKAAALVADSNALRDAIRSKLMKKGGVGYMAPTPEAFPRVPEVNEMIIACGAIPCATWLDGLSAGEQSEEELLTLLMGQGVGVLNIIPDRNWNFASAAEQELKVRKLYEVVDLARRLDLPLIAGTEMNKFGQKLIDDFESAALRPLREVFMEGAYFLYGHTLLQRGAGLGYQSAWAKRHLPGRKERNAFYIALGRAVEPGAESLLKLWAVGGELDPDGLLALVQHV
ncbi:MAG: hypothetical protein GXY76_06700 [Chloroflexi bacterium]|nr:hypothetical protein [Chloroflexota bacterium]